MTFQAHYSTLPFGARRVLADALGVSPAYLYQMATGRRPVAGTLCVAIEAATEGKVTVHDLRPDIFGPAPGVPPELPPVPASEARAA